MKEIFIDLNIKSKFIRVDSSKMNAEIENWIKDHQGCTIIDLNLSATGSCVSPAVLILYREAAVSDEKKSLDGL